MRIKIIQNTDPYLAGQVVVLPKDQAELLIKAGRAINTKDMSMQDMKIK
jgi:hypothetical protein